MKKSFSSYVKDYLMLAVLVALIILFSILGPAMANRAFFNFSNLLTMLNQNAYLVILGVGITFIMLGGGMDLSTGYLISTVGVAMALIETSSNVVVAIICGILLAVLLSAFQRCNVRLAEGIPLHHHSRHPVYLERRHLSAHRRHQQNHLCI